MTEDGEMRCAYCALRATSLQEMEFAHGKETSTCSSRRNPARRISRVPQAAPYAVAAALHVPRTRIERIAREEKPVTADTALRLGRFFKTGAAFGMNMQARFDLETAEDLLAPQIRNIACYELPISRSTHRRPRGTAQLHQHPVQIVFLCGPCRRGEAGLIRAAYALISLYWNPSYAGAGDSLRPPVCCVTLRDAT
jgi:addiction module HigA family antidote